MSGGMNRSKTAWILAACIALCCATRAAAFDVTMDVQPRILQLGEAATLSLTISGLSNPPQPSMPDIPGFVISAGGTQTSFSSINGQESRSTSFNFRLVPQQTGEFELGPFSYRAENEDKNLPAIKLQVVAAGQRTDQPSSISDMLFATLTTARTNIYNQETFDVVLSLYVRGVNLGDQVQLMNATTPGLRLNEMNELRGGREVVDNQVYDVRRFRINMSAITAGDFTFSPTLRIGVLVQRDRRRDDPFGSSFFADFFGPQVQNHDLAVRPLSLSIKSIPEEGKPASYGGAVGRFSFDAALQPTEINAGEPVTLTMTISGQGNIDVVTPPRILAGDGFRIYEPKLVNKSGGNGTTGAKTFEQVIIPRNADSARIPAIEFSYFDPELGSFQTKVNGPFELLVHATSNDSARVVSASAPAPVAAPVALGADIGYLKKEPARLDNLDDVTLRVPGWAWALQGAAPALLGLCLLFARRSENLRKDTARVRRSAAPKAARAGLSKAEAAMKKRRPAGGLGSHLGSVDGVFRPSFQSHARRYLARARPRTGPGGWDSGDRLQGLGRYFPGLRNGAVWSRRGRRRPRGRKPFGETSGSIEAVRTMKGPATRLFSSRCRAIAAIFFLGLSAIAAPAGETAPLQDAAQAYNESRFNDAIRAYENVLAQGQGAAEIFFNLGNAYYRAGDAGRAILNYRRSWLLDPRDPEITANLQFAQQTAGAVTPAAGLPEQLLAKLAFREWLVLSCIASWLAATGYLIYQLSRRQKGWALNLALASLVLLVLSWAGLAHWYRLNREPEVVIIGKTQKALFAPLADSTPHFELAPGSIVRVDETSTGWLKVRNGKDAGWIRAEACEQVFPWKFQNKS
jgi:tetratricopeptide (TPR) repeat protein